MIKDQFVRVEKPESKKDLKPKVVKRPQGKDATYVTRDVVADRGGYKTR